MVRPLRLGLSHPKLIPFKDNRQSIAVSHCVRCGRYFFKSGCDLSTLPHLENLEQASCLAGNFIAPLQSINHPDCYGGVATNCAGNHASHSAGCIAVMSAVDGFDDAIRKIVCRLIGPPGGLIGSLHMASRHHFMACDVTSVLLFHIFCQRFSVPKFLCEHFTLG